MQEVSDSQAGALAKWQWRPEDLFMTLGTPVCLVLFPILGVYSSPANDLLVGELVLPAALAALFAICLTLLFLVISKRLSVACIQSCAFGLGFICYGGIAAALGQATAPLHLSLPSTMCGAVYLLVLVLLCWLIKRSNISWDFYVRTLFIAGVVLDLVTLFPIAQRELHNPPLTGRMFGEAMPKIVNDKRPDVYLIVLDAMGDADTLKGSYGLDDSDFVKYLESKGFRVASRFRSNYDRTALSFASFLNLGYIRGFDKYAANAADISGLFQAVRNNRLFELFRNNGYKIVNVRSTFTPTRSIPNAINVGLPYGDRLFVGMLEMTLLSAFEPQTHWLAQLVACGNREIFNVIPSIKNMPGPKLVFGHSLITHPPLIFGKDGEVRALPPEFFSERFLANQYRDQLIYAQKLTKHLIGQLLENPNYQPIIVLIADHGPASPSAPRGSDPWLNERFHPFTAIHVPDSVDRSAIALDGHSLVNVFRIVMRSCFGDTTELVPDYSYVAPEDEPYKSQDITQRLDK